MSRGRPSGLYNGIRCPRCSSSHGSRVIDSRDAPDKQSRRRRHICDKCKGRFTTYEIIDDEYDKLRTLGKIQKQVSSVARLLKSLENANGTAKD